MLRRLLNSAFNILTWELSRQPSVFAYPEVDDTLAVGAVWGFELHALPA